MIENVIFDLDGTLLDTIEDIRRALNETLADFSLPSIDRSYAIASIGHGTEHLIKRALRDVRLDENDMETFKRKYMKLQLGYQLDRTIPFDGIRDLLSRLHDIGVRMFVYTNKPHAIASELITARFGMLITETLGQLGQARPKPDIAALTAMMKRHSIQGDATLFVGDSRVDIETGRAAGMKTAVVSWGYVPREVLANDSPDFLVDLPEQILKIVLDSRKKDAS